MNIPKFLLYPLGFLVLSTGIVWAGQMTLTSYYPSPSGNYNKLTSNGVGIGTTSPATGLVVTNGNVTIGTAMVNESLVVNGNITTTGTITGLNITATGLLTAGTETVTGNINAGTETVTGNINAGTETVTGNINAGTEQVTGSITTGSIITGIITAPGGLTVTGNEQVNGSINATLTITAASDARLKQNILSLTGTLSKLDQLRGVSFEWNHLAATMGLKEGQKSIGMIAQELQKVYPELVSASKNGHQEYLSIDYGKFTAVLLQSIKELKGQMNTMQDQINALQEKVKKLEK